MNHVREHAAVTRHYPHAGHNGMAIQPPAYGIDFVDRQCVVSGTEPVGGAGVRLPPRSPVALIQRLRQNPQALTPGEAQQLHRTIGNRAVRQYVAPPTANPRRGETTNSRGLPAPLKAGIETLSGVSVEQVRVHYNSPKPAALQALAYTQGAEIHVAPGQEQHLPHEAWHVVQQAQGRVLPTLQMKDGVPVNDDEELEREADEMGTKASQLRRPDSVAPGLSAQTTTVEQQKREPTAAAEAPTQGVIEQSVIQRKFTMIKAPALPTPAEAIKRATGIGLNQQLLPGTSARRLGEIQRPESVTATVTKGSIRTDAREKASELSVVTAMARAEQFLLQGVDLQKFYDAGHLIGDQLIGKTINSFEYFNLAPQVSQFNTPVYSATETDIRDVAQTHKEGVEVKVDLSYLPDYTVKVADLVRRPVIPQNSSYTQTDLQKTVTIARRIPIQWHFHAKTSGTIASTTATHGTAKPTLGQPFGVQIQDQVTSIPTGSLATVNLSERVLIGVQWSPDTSVSTEDIIGLLVKTFPDVGEPNDIAKRLVSGDREIITKEVGRMIKVAAGDIALELLDLTELLSTLKDPTVLTPLSTEVIKSELNKARATEASLEQAVAHLVTAKTWAQDLKQSIQEAKDKEPFFFSLSQLEKLHEPQQQMQNEWDFSINQSSPGYKPSSMREEEQLEQRFNFSNAKDLSFRVRNLNQPFGSRYGSFEMTSIFGENEIPVKHGEVVQITAYPPRYVRVTNLERRTNLSFGYLGDWIVTFEDPSWG